MEMIQILQQNNPDLRILSVFDPAFASYGRILELTDDARKALSAALDACPIPAEGNRYEASVPALEALPLIKTIEQTVYGGMPAQAGFCNGHGFTLNAEEYHKCSEVNYSTTGLVLLLALPEELEDFTLESEKIVGFYLPPEVLIELHPRVLHFAPCRVREEGFRCLVVLTKGTNAPLEAPAPEAKGEDRLLWMTNKWLLCHPESPQAKKGAFVGIRGENLQVCISS